MEGFLVRDGGGRGEAENVRTNKFAGREMRGLCAMKVLKLCAI